MSLSTKETGGASDSRRAPPVPARRRRKTPGATLPGVVTLARWRVRQTWRLLLVTGLGIVAAVMLVCAVPLYSDVSQSIGLRGVISTSYQSSDIVVDSLSAIASKARIEQATSNLNTEFSNKLGPYLKPLEFSIHVQPSPIYTDRPTLCSGRAMPYLSCNLIEFVGASMAQARSHLHIVQGRLPQDSGQTGDTTLDIAFSQDLARQYHFTLGSIITMSFSIGLLPHAPVVTLVKVHVVGIVALDANDPYWHGNTYQGVTEPGVPSREIYTALASNDALLTLFEAGFANPAVRPGASLDVPLELSWFYPLDPSRIVINNLDSILNQVNSVQVDVSNSPRYNQGLYLGQATVVLPSDILQRYHDRIAVAQVPVLSMLAFVLALVLFFVSMMSDFLVERQSDSISILRSRGASRLQLFGAFTVQSIALGVIALIAGPLLATALISLVLLPQLSTGNQSALTLLAGNPEAIFLNLGGFALIAVAASTIAMIISIYRAMQVDVLAMRREAARATHRPVWQRINLDIVAAIIALVGFGLSYYIANAGLLDAHLSLLLLSPLTMLRTVFLLIACLLIFLRIFQLLLRLGAWVATHSRRAPPMLALAQMARAPRQSSRMTMLFALSAAFVIFSFVFNASQAQRIPQVAAFQAGTDFSGVPEDPSFTSVSLDENTAMFTAIPGVASATLGYKGRVIGGGNVLAIGLELEGVDANTYAKTSGPFWTESDSTQSLSSLMSLLIARRKGAIVSNVIPAIVDSATWQNLHLSLYTPFSLNFVPNGPLIFLPVAKVNLIPTISDSVAGSSSGDVPSGGVLVDYRTLAAAYINAFSLQGSSLAINYAWVRSYDDGNAVASVRNALTTGCCTVLTPLVDRRAIISSLQNDPLSLDLLGVLDIGAATAMLLALAGNLIASWLSARNRLTNFAVLRALGASPPQIASILSWEQTIIYITSLLLGLFCGALLSLLALPAIIFTSVTTTGATSDLSSGAFFILQNVPPIELVIPVTLLIVLGILVVICGVALAFMIRVVSRPSIGQTLRLNAD
jgi:putative ABC transport system permease protein